jgi:hypothetical protein
MTNDQFPMTNDGGRAQRAVKERDGNTIRTWSFDIGHCCWQVLLAQ